MNEELQQAIKIVKEGGIVIFPTDTAFGVGCRLDNERAVERLFKIRNRPTSQATPVLVGSIKMAQKYLLAIGDGVKKLMTKYWPGALTIVYPCQVEKVPGLVRAQGQTLGVRIPRHPVPLSIINSIAVPILGPSANFHGASTPYKYEDLDQEFLKKVDYVLKGKCSLGMASTVIDCSQTPWKIIRQGGAEINETLY